MKRVLQVLFVVTLLLAGLAPAPLASSGKELDRSFFSSPRQQTGNFKTYLPFTVANGFTVTGQVTNPSSEPISSVAIVDQFGHTAFSNEKGIYQLTGLRGGLHALAPSRSGFNFAPSVVNLDVKASNLTQDFTGVAACTDLIVNGGFEADAGWVFFDTPYPAAYSSTLARTGTRSVRTGIVDPNANVYSYSSIQQPIRIPSDAASATLRLWLYPLSSETASAAIPQQLKAGASPEAELSSDVQYVMVLDPGTNLESTVDDTVLETLLWMRSNAAQWSYYEFNLARYAGRQIAIHIGTFNDGIGGRTAMYADDVSLEYCTTTSVTPTPTPTPVTGCSNQLGNSGFEFNGLWGIPTTEYSAGYFDGIAHSGTRSMRTGIYNTTINKFSYSDAWQAVTIPSNATSAKLSLWFYTWSTAVLSNAPQMPTAGVPFGTEALADDAQYLLILDLNGNILENLIWMTKDDQVWTYREFDLLKYKGQSIRVQFGTFNNGTGGQTAMFVDDVFVDVCTGGAATPTPTPSPTPGPTPTPGPLVCQEYIVNGGFEQNLTWEIPLTAFSADYSTDRAHTGTRSMRTGIVYATHNRFSYSDFRQTVTIPADAKQVSFTFFDYPISNEGLAVALAPIPSGIVFGAEPLAGDVQYMLILDRFGNWIDTLLWQRSDAQQWTSNTYDLSVYAGSTIKLQFGTYNDGIGGVSAMYVDDVSLQVCR